MLLLLLFFTIFQVFTIFVMTFFLYFFTLFRLILFYFIYCQFTIISFNVFLRSSVPTIFFLFYNFLIDLFLRFLLSYISHIQYLYYISKHIFLTYDFFSDILFQKNSFALFSQRHKMAFPNYIYVFAAITNLILRFSWAANRVPQVR